MTYGKIRIRTIISASKIFFHFYLFFYTNNLKKKYRQYGHLKLILIYSFTGIIQRKLSDSEENEARTEWRSVVCCPIKLPIVSFEISQLIIKSKTVHIVDETLSLAREK